MKLTISILASALTLSSAQGLACSVSPVSATVNEIAAIVSSQQVQARAARLGDITSITKNSESGGYRISHNQCSFTATPVYRNPEVVSGGVAGCPELVDVEVGGTLCFSVQGKR